MVKSMASVKVTITLPEKQLAAIRKRVAANEDASVSRFVQESVARMLDAEMALQEMVDEALRKTGGPPTAKEREWARKALDGQLPANRRGRRTKVA
jgi:Arc/MetJ-type ribon-helix-helix transcriptional regulator